LKVSNPGARLLEKQLLVIDLSGGLHSRAQQKLPLGNLESACAKRDYAVIAGLRGVFVDASHARLANADRATRRVEIANGQRDFFGRPKSLGRHIPFKILR
jgi:hypothetical protein